MPAISFAEKFFGARARCFMNFATIGVTGVEIIPAAPNRVAIAFGPCDAGQVTVGPVPSTVIASLQGFILQPNAGLMDFKFDNCGEGVCKPWSAIADAANRHIGWLEVILE